LPSPLPAPIPSGSSKKMTDQDNNSKCDGILKDDEDGNTTEEVSRLLQEIAEIVNGIETEDEKKARRSDYSEKKFDQSDLDLKAVILFRMIKSSAIELRARILDLLCGLFNAESNRVSVESEHLDEFEAYLLKEFLGETDEKLKSNYAKVLGAMRSKEVDQLVEGWTMSKSITDQENALCIAANTRPDRFCHVVSGLIEKHLHTSDPEFSKKAALRALFNYVYTRSSVYLREKFCRT
ncbi:hypothetical protein PENTCL1PPCAC_29470, partial [Pristionchus entomophagus]